MRTGVVWLIVGSALLATGCAVPKPAPEGPPPLDETAFNLRMDRLQNQLTQQCNETASLQQRQLDQQEVFTADVREVGSLLRLLRDDVQQLDAQNQESIVVREECNVENDLLENKTLLGRNEWVGLPSIGTYLKAQVDSGANTSSLSAREITPFERDGEDWVRFKLALNEDDVVVESVRDEWIEAPIERRVRIVQASGEESRLVISLLLTLGPLSENVEFTLSDRSHLDYPVLLGRRFLLDISIIDVAETYRFDRPEFPGGEPADQAADDEAADSDDSEE
ncbi:ATP-dependent zinc protease [Halomonas sp. SH5A2]|uniref:ATP-dependent zinc protease family protein n=1 Tax=Halomonas sp. SH5A2 TaxID=2749040 RepID=UPI00163F3060|nr:ATP-dependent zinc protease [Halomonas sp. SH5A2]QNI03020.1 ATP-dependent zinc protease [Halomonas sp. SH5A2]